MSQVPARPSTPFSDAPHDAPWWLAILPAAVIYPGMLLLIVAHRPTYNFMINKEGGVEYICFFALLVGVGFGVALLRHLRRVNLPAKWLTVWFGLVTLATFVLAGEEISWGQHLGFWGEDHLADWWNEANDQQETNFHNLANALDVGPTNLVVLSTFVGFVVVPLLRRWRGIAEPTPQQADYWFWPSIVALPAALGVLIIPWPKRIAEAILGDDPQVLRHSEIHETYIALLLMTYLASAWWRARTATAGHITDTPVLPPCQADPTPSPDTAAHHTSGPARPSPVPPRSASAHRSGKTASR